jgi:hypothetical protein
VYNRSTPELTVEQVEIVGQFSNFSFENRRMSFAVVARKNGIKFPTAPAGRKFKRECQEMLDRERPRWRQSGSTLLPAKLDAREIALRSFDIAVQSRILIPAIIWISGAFTDLFALRAL